MQTWGRDLVQADRCTIWLIDKDKKQLWTKVAHGLNHTVIPLDTGFVGHAIAKDTSIICNDAYNDSRFNPDVDKTAGYKTQSVLALPIKTFQNDIIGAVQCVNKQSHTKNFNEQDIAKLTLVGNYAAQTLEVAGLYREIEDTQKEVVFTLGTACEFRSKETGNHVKRVAEYSRFIAVQYGLSIEEAELIKQASPMHDIGKIAIPDGILNKPGKLTSEEFETMKTHTQIGYDMLCFSKRKLMKAASIIAYEHHEKWDGTGYP